MKPLIDFYYQPIKAHVFLNLSTIRKIVDTPDKDNLRIFTDELTLDEDSYVGPEIYSLEGSDRLHVLKQLGQGGVELPNLKPSYSDTAPADASPEYPFGTQVCVEGRNYQTISFKIERRLGTPWVNYTLAALDDSDDQIQLCEQDIKRYLVTVEPTPKYRVGDLVVYQNRNWVINRVNKFFNVFSYRLVDRSDELNALFVWESLIEPEMVTRVAEQPLPKYQIGDRVWYQGDVWEITEPGKYADGLSYYLTDVNNPFRTCTAYEKYVHILNHFPRLKYKVGDRVHYLAEDWVISYLWETIPGYTLQDPTNPDRTLKVSEREIIPSMVNRALDPVAAEVGRYDPDRDVEF